MNDHHLTGRQTSTAARGAVQAGVSDSASRGMEWSPRFIAGLCRGMECSCSDGLLVCAPWWWFSVRQMAQHSSALPVPRFGAAAMCETVVAVVARVAGGSSREQHGRWRICVRRSVFLFRGSWTAPHVVLEGARCVLRRYPLYLLARSKDIRWGKPRPLAGVRGHVMLSLCGSV